MTATMTGNQALAVRAQRIAALFLNHWASERQVRDLIDDLMRADIWHDEFLYVLDPKSPRYEDMRPAVESSLRHFGYPMPDKAGADRLLVGDHFRPIARGDVDPIDGLKTFMAEFFWNWEDESNIGTFGEPLGVKDIVMDHYQLDDWLGFMPGFLDDPEQAKEVADLKAAIVSHTKAWIDQFGNLDKGNLQVLP